MRLEMLKNGASVKEAAQWAEEENREGCSFYVSLR